LAALKAARQQNTGNFRCYEIMDTPFVLATFVDGTKSLIQSPSPDAPGLFW